MTDLVGDYRPSLDADDVDARDRALRDALISTLREVERLLSLEDSSAASRRLDDVERAFREARCASSISDARVEWERLRRRLEFESSGSVFEGDSP